MVVDDSAVVRGLLVRALSNDADIAVAGTAMHGDGALRQLKQRPVDVVILDVEMPVMDGLTALPQILAEFPDAGGVMASALTHEGAESTIRALALGAAACIAKPVAGTVSEGIEKVAAELVPLVKALGRTVAGRPAAIPSPPTSGRTRGPRTVPEVIGIGSST